MRIPVNRDHAVKRDDNHAADKSLLLGNHGEDEVVVRHGPGQVTQSVLGSLPPAFAREPAGAHRNQRLPHVVRIVELLFAQALDLRPEAHPRAEHNLAEIDQQPPPLVILQLDLPVGRGEENVHQEQGPSKPTATPRADKR